MAFLEINEKLPDCSSSRLFSKVQKKSGKFWKVPECSIMFSEVQETYSLMSIQSDKLYRHETTDNDNGVELVGVELGQMCYVVAACSCNVNLLK